MALEFLSSLLQFALRHKFVLGFYLLAFLLVFVYRKKFQFQLKVIAICRTRLGLGLMDRVAGRYRELVKLFGYIGIGVGFIGMAFIVFILGQSLFNLFTVPNAPPALSPVLPGVRIPGAALFVPFVQGIIAIFIVAVVHEFAHGVVARAHDVKVLSSGPAIVGPIFAAFVEPDEKQMRKKPDVVNYSITAAGPFSNGVLALAVVALLWIVFVPVQSAFFSAQGVLLDTVPGTPASIAGIVNGTIVTSLNDQRINSTDDAQKILQSTKPNETVVFGTSAGTFQVRAGSATGNANKPYFGIMMQTLRQNGNTFAFSIFSWLSSLMIWIEVLSLGIGLANLIPAGPLDGGHMLLLALQRNLGKKLGQKVFVIVSMVILLVILFLLSPIFREIIKSVAGLF